MVAVPNCGDMRSPCSSEWRGRRIVVSYRLPLRAVPNPDAPFRFDFYLDRTALPFKHPRCLPGDVVYVGALPATAASIPASKEVAAHLQERVSCIPVFLEEDLHKDYYHGSCMKYLWPLFHGETLRRRSFHGVCGTDFNTEQYRAYTSANTRFAERALELLVSPDEDLVYIQDYHLLTLPSIIRKRSPCTRIYFTLHSAIPCTDAFCSSPIAKELLCNLLNADLLAFASSWTSSWYHPSSYGYQGFLSSYSRLLNLSYKDRQGYSIMDDLDRTVADAMSSVLRKNEEEKQLRHEKHYRYVRSHDVGYWDGVSNRIGRGIGHTTTSWQRHGQCRSDRIYWTLYMIRMAKKKVSTFEGFFSLLTIDKRILLMNNDPEYHRAGMYRSILQDYIDMVPLQALVKTSALEVIRILKVMSSDPNNTTSSVSGRRKNKPAIWLALALHKLMSADHGYSTSSQRKNSTFSEGIPRYLAQLVAACNSSASAEQSGMALLHPNRRPLIRFLLDSGASMHVVGDAGLLHNLRHLPRAAARFATLPDGSRLPIIGIGTIQMDGFSIPNVYLVEGVTVNLVSVSRLATEHDICCCFYRNRCQLMLLADGQARVVGEAMLEEDGVYSLRFLRVPEATA